MSDKIVQVWQEGDMPANPYFTVGPFNSPYVRWDCPKCGESTAADPTDSGTIFACTCGARVRFRLVPILERLKPDA